MTDNNYKPTSMLTTAQAAELAGVRADTLMQWRYRQREGQPPYHKIGNAVRYRFSELMKWLESNSVASL